MNEHEARLKLVWRIRDVLLDLADDGTEDINELQDAMADTAEILLDALGLEIVGIEGDVINASISWPQE